MFKNLYNLSTNVSTTFLNLGYELEIQNGCYLFHASDAKLLRRNKLIFEIMISQDLSGMIHVLQWVIKPGICFRKMKSKYSKILLFNWRNLF